jgi:maltose O-acetyltransferase
MTTEKDKMIAGEMYDPPEKQPVEDRIHTRLLIKELNETREDDTENRKRIIKELLSNASPDIWLQPPF